MRKRSLTTVVLVIGPLAATASGQELLDTHLGYDLVAEDLAANGAGMPTAIVFVDDDTALVARRGDGTVVRLDLEPGTVATPGATVLDLEIIVPVNDPNAEYGIQGMALHPDFALNGWLYIRYDKSPTPGADVPHTDLIIDGGASELTANVIQRFVWDFETESVDVFFGLQSIFSAPVEARYHHGGQLVFGPDRSLYAAYGDQRRINNEGWRALTAGPLYSINLPEGVVEPNGAIVRLTDEGDPHPDNPFAQPSPLIPAGAEWWHAYGIRNSFGLAIDPVTGMLWETENGPARMDEVNRVPPGFNGGWKHVMGPQDHPLHMGSGEGLVVLPGSQYDDPAFTWVDTIGVTGLHFTHGSVLGLAYDDLLLVGCYNAGHIWALPLDDTRRGFEFDTVALQDQVDDRSVALEDPPGAEGQEIVLATGFGAPQTGVLLFARGPDELVYALTAGGKLYRLRAAADVDGDGTVGTADFLVLLGAWGPCDGPPGCLGDLNQDGIVAAIDLLILLTSWS